MYFRIRVTIMSHFEKSITQLNRKINAGTLKGAKARRRLVYAGLLTAAFAAVAQPGYNFIKDEIARQQQIQEDRRAEAERQRRLAEERSRRSQQQTVRHYIVTGVSTRLNLRTGPGTGSSNPYDIYNGACLTPTSSQPHANRGWIQVYASFNNGPRQQFYVSSRYVRPVTYSISNCSQFNLR